MKISSKHFLFKLVPRVGLQARSEIGLLYWDSKEDDKKRTEVNFMTTLRKEKLGISILMICVHFKGRQYAQSAKISNLDCNHGQKPDRVTFQH